MKMSTHFQKTRDAENLSIEQKRKRALDEHDCSSLLQLCTEVKNECRTCISLTTLVKDYQFRQSTQLSPSLQYHLREVSDLLDETDFPHQLAEIYSFAPDYDFHELRANGFRSFLSLVSICLARILTYIRNLNRQPSSAWSHNTEQSLVAYLRCLEELVHCILLIREFPGFAPRGSLFPSATYPRLPFRPSTTKTIEETLFKTKPLLPQTCAMTTRYHSLIDCFDLIQQDAFYGRCIGFYFSPTAQGLYTVLSSVMAGFADSFQGSKAGLTALVNTVYRTVTSYLSPEERGAKIADITRTADVQFCKQFWSLAENRFLVEAPSFLYPQLAVSRFFALPAIPIQLQQKTDTNEIELVTINPPDVGDSPSPVSVRVLSRERRQGMEWVLSQKPALQSSSLRSSASSQDLANETTSNPTWSLPSSTLLLHIHGGGFVALTAQTHDIYLRSWAEKLDCPIVSINYSLAPEAPYPRALDECFYAFAWVMANRPRLGARSDARVVICGDSAGGNLTLGVCLRVASLNLVEPPAGALIAYAPTLIAYVPSPSRMLSICDPLLPTGIMSRCLLAYAGVDERAYLASLEAATAGVTSMPPQPPTLLSQLFINSSTYLTMKELGHDFLSRLWLSVFSPNPQQTPTGQQSSGLNRLRMLMRNVSEPTNLASLGYTRSHNRSLSASPTQSRSEMSNSNQIHESRHSSYAKAESSQAASSSNTNTESDDSPVLTWPLNQGSIMSDVWSEEDAKSTNVAVLGDSIPITADIPPSVDPKLQKIRQCPIPQDGFLSPYLASDVLLSRLPPLGIVSCRFDPFLDDCLELAKRVDKLGVPIELHALEEMPHAFLNFAFVDNNFRRASDLCCEIILRLMRGQVTTGSREQGSAPDPTISPPS